MTGDGFLFIKGEEGFCDTWESELGVIVCPGDSAPWGTYDVFIRPPKIALCENYCVKDCPKSRFCLCGDLPAKSFKRLKSAKKFLKEKANDK